MGNVRVEVLGVAAVRGGLSEVARYVEEPDDAFEAIGDEAAKVAASYAPRLTGTLAGDLRSELIPGGTVLTADGDSLQYAGPINNGVADRNITGTHYLDRTVEDMENKAVDLLDDGIDSSIRKAGLT